MEFLFQKKQWQILKFCFALLFILTCVMGQVGSPGEIKAEDIDVEDIIEEVIEEEEEADESEEPEENSEPDEQEEIKENEIEEEYDIAVVDFEVTSPDPVLEEMGRPLSERIITELHQISGISIVERSRLEDALEEHGLQQEGIIAEEEATDVGEFVGADYLVSGSLVEVTDQFILDYRLIDVRTGKLKVAESVTGQGEEELMLDMVQNSAVSIGDQLLDDKPAITAGEDVEDLEETEVPSDFNYSLKHSIEAHEDWLRAVDISSTGARIATGSRDNTVKIWSSESGRLLTEFEEHGPYFAPVQSVKFTPDDKLVVSASTDGTVMVWEAETGDLVNVFEAHDDTVHSVAVGPENNLAVSGSDDGTVLVWRLRTGAIVNTFEYHQEEIRSLDFSSGGERIVSGAGDSSAIVWETGSGNIVTRLDEFDRSVTSVQFSSDDRSVVSGSFDGTVKVWEAETGKINTTFREHEGAVGSVRFFEDGNIIVSAGADWDDNSIKIWRSDSGRILEVLEGHNKPVWAVDIGLHGRLIASGSADHTMRIWER